LFILAAGLLLLASFYFDAGAQAWIAEHQEAGMKKFMRGVSRLGDWPGHISLGLILLVLAYWRRSKKWMRIAAAMILACALAGAVTRVVKISTGRARPSVQTEAAWSGPNFRARYNAFPSGHTAASTAFFATLALASWRIGAPFLAIPLLIAFSRIYVGAHHLSDVVCAALIGILAAWLVARWIPPAIGNPKSAIRN
jgi:undecaprenyl-diphosphatase